MKKGKLISLVAAGAVLMSTNAMAATVYVGNQDADLWTEAIYTEQNRIYGSGTYRANYEWPGTSILRNAGYPKGLLETGSMSVDEVFGESCQDLLFTDLEKTKDPVAYMEDGDRVLNIYQMTEHNGFLYVLTGGPRVAFSVKDGTDVNGLTKSYNVAVRTDNSGYDSYLYVFDISRGENYGKSRYARWSAEELGLQADNAQQYMETIAVDDDNIYILTNNNANAATNKYARGIAVFENTVNRGKEAVIPSRVDTAAADYSYGVKPIISSALADTSGNRFYESYILGNRMVTFLSGALSFAPSSRKAAAAIWVTPVDGQAGTTKIYYLTDWYASESDSAGFSLASLLKSDIVSGWSSAATPTIQDISVDGNDITFLVTYTFGGKKYKEVFVTDWSNPNAPVLADSIAFEAAEANLAGFCNTYEGFIYISSKDSIDIIKKYDYNNVKLTKQGTIDLSAVNTAEKAINVAVSGDYLFGWANQNQNSGYELKIKLKPDKTGMVEEKHMYGALRKGDAVVYGGRIYTCWGGQSGIGDAARQSCVFVADTNKMMPVSLNVDKVESKGAVPYVITGTGQNIDAVKVIVNGQDKGYVKTTFDGLNKWQYTVNEAGDYTIEFVGASMEGHDCYGTAEKVKLTAYSKSDALMTSSYTVSGNRATVTVSISNPNSVAEKLTPIAGLYSDNTMASVVFGDEIEVGAGETKTVTLTLDIPEYSVNYKVKTFLIGGTKIVAPYSEAVES